MSGNRGVPLVAHIVHGLRTGGLENGLVNLINRTPCERYRHAVICLTGYDRFAERIERADTDLVSLGKREGKDPGLYLRMWRTLRRLRPDVVHTRNLGALDMLVPARLAGIPVRIHGEHGRDMVDLHGTNRRYLRMRRLLRPLAHRYVALSADFAEYLARTVHIPEERIEHICNGVDLQRFRPDLVARERLRAERGWSPSTPVIGWVGRMEPVKNPQGLARAFVDVCDRMSGSGETAPVLAMIGNGAHAKEIRDLIEAAGLRDRVWLPGSRDDIPEVLRAMDMFVLPSLAEGISNTILEAMATGLPVIATRVGGNAELIREGETGCLVAADDDGALADAIEYYLNDQERMHKHGAAARARVEEHFDLDGMVTAYLGLYDRLLAGAAPRHVGCSHSEVR